MYSIPIRRTAIAVAVSAALTALAAFAIAQDRTLARTMVRQADLHFVAKPNGTYQAAMVGDVATPGPYAAQTRLPAGLRIPPHFHPEDRIVLVMSGTLQVGYGEKFDEAKMTALPPGSVFTEPGREPHFTWAKDGDVILYVTGRGPTATTWLDQKK
jgi:quercetin dioxygenase-like cupin family protein